ncbi:MAG TPA: glycosyltransferase family 4 protein [Acidimicrobiales bacterium]|nr:glycosyltransferase family 4 protein [Acidimicrobiales bacterium]
MTEGARSAGLAFAVTLALAPLILVLLRRRALLDHPNDRSSHESPTPRGLGLAPAIGALVALVAIPAIDGSARTGLLIAAAGFGLLGLLEDVAGVAPLPRLGAQLLIAGASLFWLLDGLGGPAAWQVVFAAGCALWLVAYVNAFNFMDGINGISAAQVLVAAGAWWAIGHIEDIPALSDPALVIGAATLAFTPFNFPTARAFLGDVGSYFLGAWLAVAVIVGLRAGLPPEAVIAPLSLYLADTATTIVRRVRTKEAWYLPHRSHAYQRLTQLGWSHTRTTLAVAVTMAATSALGALSLTDSLALRAAGDTVLAAALAAYLLSPSALDETASPPG